MYSGKSWSEEGCLSQNELEMVCKCPWKFLAMRGKNVGNSCLLAMKDGVKCVVCVGALLSKT